MPVTHDIRSTSDAVAYSKRSEGMSGAAWRVLEEDGMLGLCAKVWHVVVVVSGRGHR